MSALEEFLDDVLSGLANIPVALWWALGGLIGFLYGVLS